MELQEVEKREVPEESKDECGLMPSILQGSSDSHQPYSNDKFKDLEADLGQDGACGCSHAKEEEIPTNISGSPHIISPHKLCRPKKVISEDRLHRHISVESRKKGLLWNSDIRWIRELAFFFLPRASLCHPDPSVRHLTHITCDNSQLPQLEIPRRCLSELAWSQCVVPCNDLIFVNAPGLSRNDDRLASLQGEVVSRFCFTALSPSLPFLDVGRS